MSQKPGEGDQHQGYQIGGKNKEGKQLDQYHTKTTLSENNSVHTIGHDPARGSTSR